MVIWEDRWLARPSLVLFFTAAAVLVAGDFSPTARSIAGWLGSVAFALQFAWCVVSLHSIGRMKREMAEAQQRWAKMFGPEDGKP